MSSQLAKLRYITDQAGFHTFWGSNEDEQHLIDNIKKRFEPYLYDRYPPKGIISELGPAAERMLDGDDRFEPVILMYENYTPPEIEE